MLFRSPYAWAPARRFAGAARLCGIEDARTRCSSGTFSDSRWLSDPRVRGRLDSVQSGGKSWLAMTACRSEEHTSELQSLMRISYAVFCLKKKKNIIHNIVMQLLI